MIDWGARPRKNCGIHIAAFLSRQPLVKGERLVRYEVNAVMLFRLIAASTQVIICRTRCSVLFTIKLIRRTDFFRKHKRGLRHGLGFNFPNPPPEGSGPENVERISLNEVTHCQSPSPAAAAPARFVRISEQTHRCDPVGN